MIEKIYYESKPFAYLALATFAFKGPYSSPLADLSGAVLMFCGATVLILRARGRGLL